MNVEAGILQARPAKLAGGVQAVFPTSRVPPQLLLIAAGTVRLRKSSGIGVQLLLVFVFPVVRPERDVQSGARVVAGWWGSVRHLQDNVAVISALPAIPPPAAGSAPGCISSVKCHPGR